MTISTIPSLHSPALNSFSCHADEEGFVEGEWFLVAISMKSVELAYL